MPSTTTHGLPVPVSTDAPAGHTQMTTLANSLDAQLLTTVTSLPGSPVDGQRCLFLADATNGVVWDLRYRSASGSSYKWECVGGGQLSSEILTAETTTSASYVDLTTVGPSITIPLAGDYEITWGADTSIAATVGNSEMALKFGAATVSTDDRLIFLGPTVSGATGNLRLNTSRTARRTVTAAATVLKCQYLSNASGATWQRRALLTRPVRVG